MTLERRRLAMFPLSTMVFPGAVLPLHIFEPRYQALMADCLADDGRFGVVLITRGREVGGGDVRAEVGTQVAITNAAPLDDGRWYLLAQGERRVRIEQWLEDAPYPQAMVTNWPDTTETVAPALLQDATHVVRRTRALLSETRDAPALPPDVTFDDDPTLACWQLCAQAPLSTYDAQRLLAAEGTVRRLQLLAEVTSELEDDLHRLLAQ
ncbi:MAG TPA: LON peptidase substrate-binding domain-containing protein [Acidimicrobiales bacterium]|jgi:Lon protease-like protein